MKNYILLLLLLAFSCRVEAQTYTVRTDTNIQAYPGTIPCPASSCAGGGNVAGANTIIVPSDFNNTVTRITDVNTFGGPSQTNANNWGVDSSAEVNPFNKNDDRFVVSGGAGQYVPFIWNGTTHQASQMYAASFPATGGFGFGGQVEAMPFWSFTQPYIVYTVEFTAGGDPALYSYDFTSTVTPPSRVLLKDLADAGCVPAMAGVHPVGVNFSVSHDDNNFGLDMGTNGNTGLIWAVVWNRTQGCRVWETDNGAVTGDWGTTGTIDRNDRFWQHNVRISLDGNWLRIDEGQCLSGDCTGGGGQQTDDIWFWHIADLSTTEINAATGIAAGGHQANGYTHIANEGQAPDNPMNFKGWVYRAYATPGSVTDLTPSSTTVCTSNGAAGACSGHDSWANDNPSDTNPIFSTMCSNTGAVIAFPWDSEIIGVSTNGSGKVYRFSHTYGSCASQFFNPLITIGSVSQSGNWFMWASDWMGMLGNTDHSSASCTIGSNCRADVFITGLSQGIGTILTPGAVILQGVTVK